MSAAIDAFKEALAQAEGMLPQFNGVISAPDPIIEAAAPDPLFASNNDYHTASLRLIAAKRLDGAGP